jgi:outer membrane receptor protein involved in Fe transport
MFSDETNSDAPQVQDKMRIKGLLNASIDFKTRDGRWDLRLWGRNLTNTRYATAFSVFISTARAFGFTGPYYADASWNDPRTFGATVTYYMR